MRSLPAYYLGICALILTIAFITGCTGTERTSQNTNFSLETVTIVTPLHQEYLNEKCPIPVFIFNNSQSFTTLHTGLVVTDSVNNQSSDNYPIPTGSIIYHLPDSVTRIFDSSGRQILIVNDSESTVQTGPHGIKEATRHVAISGEHTEYGSKNITYYINEGNPYHLTCSAIIIYSPFSNAPVLPMIPLGQ
jgi:hypothetical protein